jgi:hypothetical protein
MSCDSIDYDDSSLITCIDMYFQLGIAEFVHVSIAEPLLITPEYARFDARGPLNRDRLQDA